MILVWSSEGGPLQYAGLALFALQFILPQIINSTIQLENGLQMEMPVGLLSFIAVFGMGLVWIAWHCFRSWQANVLVPPVAPTRAGARANGDAAREGSTNNDDMNNNSNANNENGEIPPPSTTLFERACTFFSSISPTHLMLASGFVLPLSAALPFLLAAGDSGIFANAGSIGVMLLAITAHACMAFAAYGVLRDVLAGTSPYPGARGGQQPSRRGRAHKFTVGEIAEILRKVPVEEFVSEEDVRSGGCSISRMKRMLKNRGAAEAAERCVEREDLVDQIFKVRKFNEECAICAEQYEEGDAMRVLHCQHEFHLHCCDRWLYTFATESRHDTEPTCPLCKAELQ